MQKVIARATVALCTLSIGVAVSLITNAYRVRSTPPGDIPAANLKVVPYFTERWRRVTINRTFSFYLPETMTTDLPRYQWGSAAGSFSDSSLSVSYAYSTSLSCEPDLFRTWIGYPQFTSETIDGKPASLTTEQFDPAHLYAMTLCFSDIGDHATKLRLAASGRDAHALHRARQIFDSIEFP